MEWAGIQLFAFFVGVGGGLSWLLGGVLGVFVLFLWAAIGLFWSGESNLAASPPMSEQARRWQEDWLATLEAREGFEAAARFALRQGWRARRLETRGSWRVEAAPISRGPATLPRS